MNNGPDNEPLLEEEEARREVMAAVLSLMREHYGIRREELAIGLTSYSIG